ncbi:MAG: BLUF domain-containing protein [Planctomycetota bacterium]
MPVHHLLYISDASDDLNTDNLDAMVRPFRTKNRARGVTGVLFYSAGHFIQLLEGAGPIVERLYETIRADPRHHNVRRLVMCPVDRRMFREWDMGLLNLDERSKLDQQRLVRLVREAEQEKQETPLALRLLSDFCMMLPRPSGEPHTVES